MSRQKDQRSEQKMSRRETEQAYKTFSAALASAAKNLAHTPNEITDGNLVVKPPYTFVEIVGRNRVGYGFSKYNPNDAASIKQPFDPSIGARIAFQDAMRDFLADSVHEVRDEDLTVNVPLSPRYLGMKWGVPF